MAISVHQHWSSRFAFLFAAVGSAVGLGNIWRFPYVVGENGGSAFVLVYIGFVVLIGWPVLVAEFTIGRRGQMSPVKSVETVAVESGSSPHWKWVGAWGAFAGGLGLLSFYSMIAGWVLAYIIKAAAGTFAGFDSTASASLLDRHYSNTPMLVFWHFVFIALTITIVGRGVQAGLEKAVTFLMPLLLIILVSLVGYSATTPGFGQAIDFLFTPDFGRITPAVMLTALGQAFFSLGLTVGTMIAYGAYLSKDTNIVKSAGIVAASDTAIAVISGLAIFPLVYTYQLEPGEGPGLIFTTLTVAFGQMPGGAIFGTLFFLMLAVAAITSSISLLEPAVSYFEEKQGINRWTAAVIAGAVAFCIGLLSVFSFNEWSDLLPLAFVGVTEIGGQPATFYAVLNFFVSNIVMPFGGLALAVFTGWFVSRKLLQEELGLPDAFLFKLLHWLLKFLCPLALLIVIIAGLI